MTSDAFIDICEKSFSEQKVRLGPHQKEIYSEKLRRFSGAQLDAIFDKVLELTRNFPKIRDIYDAARELGFLQTELDVFHVHEWKDSDCRLCGGEGRLLVIWELAFTANAEEQHTLKKVQPYSGIEGEMGAHDFRSIYRCACMAGDASSVPQSWPKWSKSIEPVRIVR